MENLTEILLTVADSTVMIPFIFNWTLTLTLEFELFEPWKGPIYISNDLTFNNQFQSNIRKIKKETETG